MTQLFYDDVEPGDELPPLTVTVDETQMFFFSAATYNGHRIHYDKQWARDVEGYDDVLVQGPLQAALLARAITDWIGRRLAYVLGSSAPTDGAVDTLMAGQGVCRDFAHLGVTICRGLDIPARAVAVYAPGLWPMDFHAVFEAYTGDAWHVHDATRLAPRQGLVRIATGRDAADTAFATVIGGRAELRSTEITAVADGALPEDRWDLPVILP